MGYKEADALEGIVLVVVEVRLVTDIGDATAMAGGLSARTSRETVSRVL